MLRQLRLRAADARLAILGAALVLSGAAAPEGRAADLQAQLQAVLESEVARNPTLVFQLGWKSDTATFSLAAGNVMMPGKPVRQATVQDTFLFGSGTKPFTAVAILSLVGQGALSLDDPLEKHVDKVFEKLQPGTSLQSLFGTEASKITVGHVLRMESGVQDFDFPPFDNYLLLPNETYLVHSPLEFVQYASTQKPLLLCDPGTCVDYSSNNYVLAGFVLLSFANVTEWWQLDLKSFYPAGARSSLGDLHFFQKEMLQPNLTVQGHAGGGWAKAPNTTIWNQSSTILGWTCGNVVGTAMDVASFFWDLLGPEPRVLPGDVVAEITKVKPITTGWGKGQIQYGTGIMLQSVKLTGEPKRSEWGSILGHGGDTFGFLSQQGILTGLNASVALVSNSDSNGLVVQYAALCRIVKVAAKVLLAFDPGFLCVPVDQGREAAIAV